MWLALHRFYREKWWDKRASAYLELIDVLYDFKTDYETIADNEYDKTHGYDWEGNEHEVPLDKDAEAELWQKLSLTHKKLEKIKGLGPLIFKEDVLNKISKFIEEDRKVSQLAMNDHLDNHDAYNEISNSASELYEEFKQIALLELKVTSRYSGIYTKAITIIRERYEKGKELFRDKFQ